MDTLKDILTVIGIIIVLLFVVAGLTKCQQDSYEAENHLQPIDGYTYLVYDPDTLVIYYQEENGIGHKGFGYMAPYYSEYGKLCRWVNNKIVEIE